MRAWSPWLCVSSVFKHRMRALQAGKHVKGSLNNVEKGDRDRARNGSGYRECMRGNRRKRSHVRESGPHSQQFSIIASLVLMLL